MEENVITSKAEKANPNKKRSKSMKKSIAAENEKRQKCLDTLLICNSLPVHVAEVLKQEQNERGQILKLDTEEIEKFWQELQGFVEEEVSLLLSDEVSQTRSEVMIAVVTLLQYTAMFHNVTHSETFTKIAVLLNSVMSQKDFYHKELQNKICELSEYCCIKELRVPGEFYLNTVNHLFDLTLNENAGTDLKSEIKRMWEMHIPLSRMNLRTQSCEPVVSKLARVIVSPAYLSCKEGRQFIAFAFTLDIKMIKKFHQAVKDFLGSCKRSQATSYGEAYYSAWVNSSTDTRQALETQCIQNFMTHMFTFPRKKQELSHVGQNVFAILSYLHHHRCTIPHFSKTLTELYMPLLWRHLRSGNNIERCNAAEVFLDMYPLEKPGAGKAEESAFLEKQHSEMVDLLTDNCHIVRIIAIKGVCNKLCSAWSTFPPDSVQVLMRNLIALAVDGSTAIVRRTLFDSLRVLLLNPESATYLARILPSLRDHIHDENEKVRCSFIKLLCDVKALPEPAPIKYWKIVSINHLAARLELESMEVGSALAKLLMSNIYSVDVSVDKFLYRLIKFIQTSPLAARKLFQFSSKVLDVKGAVRVMLTILLNLRAHVKKKEELVQQREQERKESQPPVQKRKKRRSTEPLQPIIENDEEGDSENKENNSQLRNISSEGSVKSETEVEVDEYSLPGVAHALIDIVSLLWSIHSNSLIDPDHEEDHNNLLDLACAGIPLFLKYYKGTPTYYAVIHLASLVPAAKLTPVSTVCSACVSHLKQVSEMTPQSELKVIIHALCSWNRFADILDVVIDWLDQAFRCEGLNQSQAQKEGIKQRKVRFVAKGGKPMLALKLLDAVFAHPINSGRVLEKSYNQVHELYVYMERIKILVERRLLGGLPFDSPMLSDEFLLKCLYRYSKLILILHRPEPQTARGNQSVIDPFDASIVFRDFIQWTTRVIRPMIPQRLEDDENFSVLLLDDILRTASNLIDLNYAREDTVIKLAELTQGLLRSECSLLFVESSMKLVKHLKDHSEAMYGVDDNARLMKTVIPSLLSQALKCLSETKYTKEQVVECMQNMHEVKSAIFEVVQCLLRMFGPDSILLHSVLRLFTDALVTIINHGVKQLQLLDTVEKVQELPFVCGLLISIVDRPSVAPLWLATVPSSISQLYSRDGNLLVAVVSLLYTLAHSGLNLPQTELTAAVREAYSAVTGYIRESTQLQSDQSESDFSTESIDVKKVAPPVLSDLAAFLNCTLR